MKFSIFKAEKKHCILHRHVFVMLVTTTAHFRCQCQNFSEQKKTKKKQKTTKLVDDF